MAEVIFGQLYAPSQVWKTYPLVTWASFLFSEENGFWNQIEPGYEFSNRHALPAPQHQHLQNAWVWTQQENFSWL